ncbi:MAG: pilus assembly protein TadG-related protein [Proteobacteria bacterium]|nr:pilus assembly protein TadG-related protein [Pseudomonadota bacterium]
MSILKNIFSIVGRLRHDSGASVAVYSAAAGALVIGGGALALDVGRVVVLRSQTQNFADAAAVAAASQLDSRTGAQTRATAVAMNATAQSTYIASDGANITVQAVNFYSEIDPTPVAATSDEDSKFVEVILNPKSANYMFSRILDLSATGPTEPTDHSINLNTSAIAGSSPFICEAPPLMICDPAETDPSLDISLPANAGRQIPLKPPPSGGTAWAPGNYGLLALPDGSLGASAIEAALAAVEQQQCYQLDVVTAPGVKTEKVENGINARFDIPGGLPYPAPNVINYPKDPDVEADPSIVMGNGNWNVNAYWTSNHTGGFPSDLSNASRYQVYLYELGLEFARNGTQTIYPIEGTLPAGFTTVTPPAVNLVEDLANPDDPDFDGVPSQTPASNGYARRLVRVAILQCIADDVKGSHSYPTNGKYLEAFITEAVDGAPAGGIYAEVVRPITTTTDPDFHANVRLVK